MIANVLPPRPGHCTAGRSSCRRTQADTGPRCLTSTPKNDGIVEGRRRRARGGGGSRGGRQRDGRKGAGREAAREGVVEDGGSNTR